MPLATETPAVFCVPTSSIGITSSGFEKSHGSLKVSVAKSPDVDSAAGVLSQGDSATG